MEAGKACNRRSEGKTLQGSVSTATVALGCIGWGIEPRGWTTPVDMWQVLGLVEMPLEMFVCPKGAMKQPVTALYCR